jgi:hypothetical protein
MVLLLMILIFKTVSYKSVFQLILQSIQFNDGFKPEKTSELYLFPTWYLYNPGQIIH